jgi:micrococcal nuclease
VEHRRGGTEGLWARFRAMPTRAHVALGVLLLVGVLGLPDAEAPPADVEVAASSAAAGRDDAARAAAREAAEQRRAAAAEAAASAEAAEAEAAARAEAEAEAEAEAAAAARAAEGAEARAAGEAAATTWTVHHVVDGDTVDVRRPDGAEERVRVVGIDTPERGECGFGPATSAMVELVLGREVELVAGARDDRDRYDRILRYVDVDGTDAGLALIERGLAVARYDSRDGYGRHDREDAYVAVDAATPHVCPSPSSPDTTTSGGATSPAPSGGGPGTGPGGAWRNCTEARAAGAAPVRRGDPGFGDHLDRDRDGIGCE